MCTAVSQPQKRMLPYLSGNVSWMLEVLVLELRTINLIWKINTKEVASPVKMEEGFRNEAKNADYFRKSSLKVKE